MTGQAPDLVVLLAGADRDELARTVRSVAAMHEPDPSGRCRYCQPPARWWRRRQPAPCQTSRVIVAELRTNGRPRWMPA